MKNLYEKPESESIALVMEASILSNRGNEGMPNQPVNPGFNRKPAPRIEEEDGL